MNPNTFSVFISATLIAALWMDTPYDAFSRMFTSHDGFSMILDRSENKMTDCHYLGGGYLGDLDTCKIDASTKGGNAFNYKDGVCYYKKCEGGDLKLVENAFHGGWDVYSLPPENNFYWFLPSIFGKQEYNHSYITSCIDEFSKIHDRSDFKVTDCHHLGGGNVENLESCKSQTCVIGGNAFNYRDGVCYYKKCDGGDLKLVDGTFHDGGWDVYSLPSESFWLSIFAPHHGYTDYHKACFDGFSKILDHSANTITNCHHLGGGNFGNLDTCKAQTCINGGNAFNYKDGVCYYKKCVGGYLHLAEGTPHGGWDVYSLKSDTSCFDAFSKIFDRSEIAITDCDHLGGGELGSLNNCKAHACANGGNAFNYRDGVCYYKKCKGGSLQLAKGTVHGGWDVYSLPLDTSCFEGFSKIHDHSENKMTNCHHLGGANLGSLNNCKAQTCVTGGNAFNYKDGVCYHKKCEEHNLRLTESPIQGGWDVYSLADEGTCTSDSVAIETDGVNIWEVRYSKNCPSSGGQYRLLFRYG